MTKIKKRDLRKRLPQVPINYPGPDVIPFDYENEKAKVENLCKRLADNEVEVRDAVLAELPRYLKEVCTNFTVGTTTLADVERAAAATIDLASFDAGTQLWDALMKDPSAANLALLLEKLCLGLFYCLWHSDKPLVQHECSLKIVQLIGAMPTALLKDLFVRSMLRTLVRHWSKIDQWRMDKYMAMVRKLCYEVISHLAAEVTAAPPVAATSSPAEATPAKSAGKKSGKTPAKAPKTVEVPKEDTEATNSIDIASAARHPTLLRIASTFQWDVIRSEVGVGLTMHMADLFLTEMMRCEALTVEQFVAVAAAIPLYIMQRGNYIEKRVMDNFVVPIAAGALEKRSQDFSIQVASILAVQFEAMSVSRSTHFNVRPLMFEAQRLMENYVGVTTQPELFEMVTKRDERSRMAKEIRAAEDVKMRLSQIAMKHAAAEGVVRAARRAAKPQPTSKRSARWKKF